MKIIISIILVTGVILSAWYFLNTVNDDMETRQTDVPDIPTESSTIKIIAFGDSLTAGLGLPLSESYPAQLEGRLRERAYEIQIINSGVSGETTAGNRLRADFIRAQNPHIVILGIGGNDALRFLSIDDAFANIHSTLTTLLSGQNPPTVLLLSMLAPSNAGTEYKKSFDAMYASLATEFNVPLVPFIVNEVARTKEFLQADGIHPTKEGYSLLIENYILPAVELALETL